MPKITGNEPFYPIIDSNNLPIPIDTLQEYLTGVKMATGITIRQEAILRFMVETSKNWAPHMSDLCAKDAVKFADSYIKILNHENSNS